MLQRRDAILLTGRSPLSRQSQSLREHCDARPRHCELMSGPVILRHTKVREMTPRIRLVRAMLIGICLQALTGYMSGATLAAAVSQAPPIHAGWRRSGSYANSSWGKAWPRQSSPRTSCPWVRACPVLCSCAILRPESTLLQCRATGSISARRQPFSSLRGRRPTSRSNRCAPGPAQAATTSSATLSMYGQFRRIGREIFPTLTYLGQG
jgi:hypothetical protein